MNLLALPIDRQARNLSVFLTTCSYPLNYMCADWCPAASPAAAAPPTRSTNSRTSLRTSVRARCSRQAAPVAAKTSRHNTRRRPQNCWPPPRQAAFGNHAKGMRKKPRSIWSPPELLVRRFVDKLAIHEFMEHTGYQRLVGNAFFQGTSLECPEIP